MSAKKKIVWDVKATRRQVEESVAAREIAQELELCLPTAQLIINRGCKNADEAKDFLENKTDRLYDPFLMKDMRCAAEHLLTGVAAGKQIVIYGDYDVDGVTSVSILYMYFLVLGAAVNFYIPSRIREGYGMTEAVLHQLKENGCDLIVTVDTGITAIEEAKIIRSLGMELIVTDHHACHTEVPAALAVVNPRQPECPYPFKELAGVGVVFKLLCAMEILRFQERTVLENIRCVSDAYMDLVAMGTVADVMPLRDENRLIVSRGLHMMETAPRTSIAALLDAANTDAKPHQKRKITSGYIGYTIAPRINAAGRIRSASIAVELLLTKERSQADVLAKELCKINQERQLEENKIMEQAFNRIDGDEELVHDPVIVLADESWHHGIIGIVASRVAEKYGKPCILISFDNGEGAEGDIGKGSGRSVKGMNLVEALTHCADLLIKYGGHELAAGLSVSRNHLAAFRRRINDYARGCFSEKEPVPVLEAECELIPADIHMTQAAELYRLEPFGVSNPMPLFVMREMRLSSVSGVGGGKHVKMTLAKDTLVVTAMFFRKAPNELDLYEGDSVDVLFQLDINTYQNVKNLQFIVKDIRLSDASALAYEKERQLYWALNSGESQLRLTRQEAESIVPSREDLGALYNLIKKELRMERDTFSMRSLCNLLQGMGRDMRYVKVQYMIRIFQELNILGVEKIEDEREIYRFKYIYVKTKADLNKSNILKKLRTACVAEKA